MPVSGVSSPTTQVQSNDAARAESKKLLDDGNALGVKADQESSAELGKKALGLLRQAVTVDATNHDAWREFGKALLRINDVTWLKRPFAISMVAGGSEQFGADCARAAKALESVDGALAGKLKVVKP